MSGTKQGGFDFWLNTLKGCQYVVAPMVDQSELAWRMLCRRYGAQLCYTPMFHSSIFVRDAHYRKESLQSCPEDRPLIMQFCANDPDTLLAAAKLAENHCDAIDLNLGCPQMIAKRGHYGAYLQDDWELLERMIRECHSHLNVPITCKIRVFETIEKTVDYAKMLVKAGCQLLTVHGRTRDMKGAKTGLANWDYVKAIKKAVDIPVFSNGNIQYLSDVKKCLEETGVEAVMSAESNLHNPALFAGLNPPIWQMCEEYLDLVQKYPCPLPYARGHVFKILHHGPEEEDRNHEKRELLHRPVVIQQIVMQEGLSKNKVKKRLRNPNKNFDGRKKIKFDICNAQHCCNPRGQKCNYNLCKGCCREKTSTEIIDCIGHRIQYTTHPALITRKDNCHSLNNNVDKIDVTVNIRNCASDDLPEMSLKKVPEDVTTKTEKVCTDVSAELPEQISKYVTKIADKVCQDGTHIASEVCDIGDNVENLKTTVDFS